MSDTSFRNGDIVTSLVDDGVNVYVGLRGVLCNNDSRLRRTRVNWINDTASIVSWDTIVSDRQLREERLEAA